MLVVGGGQAGLTIAAGSQLQVDTLIVDREQRIGDNWRKRYHALTLHNQVQVNHLPYMPFPPTWPTYIPKDKLANWFETYVDGLELNFWTATEFEGGIYDERRAMVGACCAAPTARARDASAPCRHRNRRQRHSELPSICRALTNSTERCSTPASITMVKRGRARSAGHRHRQQRPRHRPGLYSSGAEVTIVQRSSTLVVNVEPSAQLPYALYDEGRRWKTAI